MEQKFLDELRTNGGMSRIEKALEGKSSSAGGLNLADILRLLRIVAPGVSVTARDKAITIIQQKLPEIRTLIRTPVKLLPSELLPAVDVDDLLGVPLPDARLTLKRAMAEAGDDDDHESGTKKVIVKINKKAPPAAAPVPAPVPMPVAAPAAAVVAMARPVLGWSAAAPAAPPSSRFGETNKLKNKKALTEPRDFRIKIRALGPGEKVDPPTYPITLEALEKLIADDKFILQLLKSEHELLKYKITKYQKVHASAQRDLAEAKAKIKLAEEVGTRNTGSLEGVAMSANEFLKRVDTLQTAIATRLSALETTPISRLVSSKREAVIQIINDPSDGIKTVTGTARQQIRNMLYGKIVAFATGPMLFIDSFINSIIMGGAGLGKTKLATVMSFFYSKLGIFVTDRVKIVSRSDLVGEYIGQTGPKTKGALNDSLEGILFIDEAYQLSGCPNPTTGQFEQRDFGLEAITEIVNYLDKNIGLIAVLAAGYKYQMTKCFLASNEGLTRRFPDKVELEKFTSKDLYDIFEGNLKKRFSDQPLHETQQRYFADVIDKLYKAQPEIFINQAGDMLNLAVLAIEDYVLSENYGVEEINNTFRKFTINQGYDIEF